MAFTFESVVLETVVSKRLTVSKVNGRVVVELIIVEVPVIPSVDAVAWSG